MSIEDPGRNATDREPPGVPRWVKVTGMVTGGFVVLLVLAALVLGGDHGPGRHVGGDEASPAHTAPPGANGGHTPPPGAHE
jgi:hypothetical protein